MSSSDGLDGLASPIFEPDTERPGRGVESHLLEALIYILIEKGVLTRNDALSVVETVAHVRRGQRETAGNDGSQTLADLKLLQRLYVSFEALDDRPGVVNFDAENVRRLRPPIHGDHPTFPRDD